MSPIDSRQTVQLQLTPMQLLVGQPPATTNTDTQSETSGWQLEGEEQQSVPRLRLSPGTPSEMLVQIQNLSDRPLRLEIRATGDFPSSWCRLGGTEGQLLPPHQRMDAVLRFELADDFFENRDALRSPQHTLPLDYQGQVQIYRLSNPEGESSAQSLVSSELFHLHVRPHSLYPEFLPEIYREVDFIGRFLKIFEQSFEPTVNILKSFWAYLDPRKSSEALLPFFAQWVGWPADVPWTVAQQRQLIGNALEIYRWRGTKRGLRLYLSLYTELPNRPEYIEIRESFTQGFVMGETTLGETSIVGGGRPFHFTVRLHSSDSTHFDERLIRTIIEQEKPAFCTYALDFIAVSTNVSRSQPPPSPLASEPI